MSRNKAENRRHLDTYKHINRDDYLVRAHEFAPRGEKLSKKLNNTDVIEIRKNVKGETMQQLASRFGVHKHTIYKIQHRLTWSHI
jgi:hypothetical protein